MPVTIIEGPDASGKTTLMKQGFPTEHAIHCGPPDHHGPWRQYSGQLASLFHTNPNKPIVFDRFLYGELVYGPILRPKTATGFTTAHVRMLERVLLSMQAVLVFCQTDWETTKTIWQERQDSELIKDDKLLHETWERFDQLFGTWCVGLPMVTHNFQNHTSKDTRELVEEARPKYNMGPGIGNWKEGVTLMIGEQINENAAVSAVWPFVADGGSSLWLAQQLDSVYAPESQFYWVNAMDKNKYELDPAFVSDLKPARIIAMGKTAEVWCRRHLSHIMPAENIPHPQFWKRFHSREQYPLLPLLGADAVSASEELI